MSESNNANKPVDRMTKFERVIVFRVARGYFFAMAMVAVLLFVGGVAIGARSLVKAEVAKPPAPTATPARAPLTYGVVATEIQREEARAKAGGAPVQVDGDTSDTKGGNADDAELEAASKELRAAFPDPPYSWDNEIEKTCTAPTSFGCLAWGTRVKRQGVVSALGAAFRGTPRDQLVSYIRVLARVLKEAPVEKRLEIAPLVIATERQEREKHEALVASHERSVKEAEEKYNAEVELNNAKYQQWRQSAIYGIAAGFALLIVVSLFLAFLSMERHTRALEQVTRHLSQRNQWGGPDSAA